MSLSVNPTGPNTATAAIFFAGSEEVIDITDNCPLFCRPPTPGEWRDLNWPANVGRYVVVDECGDYCGSRAHVRAALIDAAGKDFLADVFDTEQRVFVGTECVFASHRPYSA